jgi:outer membrane usher protein
MQDYATTERRRRYPPGRTTRLRNGIAIAAVLALIGAATPAAPSIEAPPAAASSTDQVLYLRAFVNGSDRNLIVRVEQRSERFFLDAETLAEIGVLTDQLSFDADGRIALDAFPDLRYRYDEAEQRIDLGLPDVWLRAQLLGNQPVSRTAPGSDTGLVLDYAARLQDSRTSLAAEGAGRTQQTLSLATNFRVFSPIGLFINSGHANFAAHQSEYVREDTYWTWTDLGPMRRYTLGDYIGSALPWTRSIRLGGARIASNFDVRPDLITFPVPELGGSAVVPSAVDLYVNGARQFSTHAEPGPFLITQPPALTGAGTASVVYRDALGQEVATTLPLYIDTRLLATGLTDYAIEAGYARRNYGIRSFDYASSPVASVSLRHGVTDTLTLEAHGEAGERLGNIGAGGLLRLGQLGVLSAAAAGSGGNGQGTQLHLGYQYIAARWNVDVQERRAFGSYRDLGSLEGIPVPQRQGHAVLGVQLSHQQSVSLSHAHQRIAGSEGSRIVSLGYNASLFASRVGVFANLYRDIGRANGTGAIAGISITLDKRTSAYANLRRERGENRASVGATRPVDYDLGGFGWAVSADSGNRDYHHGLARLDYRNRYGDWSAAVERSEFGGADYTSASLSGTGALVWMAGRTMATRAIPEGFALVSTNGVSDVPVLRENRPLGRTDSRGHLLVPDLPAWRSSQISIDTLALPVDARVATEHQLANPRERSGVLVDFPIDRYTGATLVLVDETATPLPPGTPIVLLDTSDSALIGYDGQVFFASLQAMNRFYAKTRKGGCRAEVRFDARQAMQTLGPFTCVAESR